MYLSAKISICRTIPPYITERSQSATALFFMLDLSHTLRKKVILKESKGIKLL